MIVHLAALCTLATTGFQPQQGALQQGAVWLQNAWVSAQKQGRPAAEAVIREFPERFRAMPKRAAELQKRYGKTLASLKLEEKKSMLLELWRIRQGLNLMALIDSGLLEQLTGIDSKLLRSAQQQVATLTRRAGTK
jgi:hypothetical protein